MADPPTGTFFYPKPPNGSYTRGPAGMGFGGPNVQLLGTLSVLFHNARSTLPKMNNLAAFVLVQEPDIVSFVESWLDRDVGQCEIMLPKFFFVRLDRSRHGSGILLWIRATIVFKVLQSGPQDPELILISTDLPKCKKLCLRVFYHPPASSVALFDSLLEVSIFTVCFCW